LFAVVDVEGFPGVVVTGFPPCPKRKGFVEVLIPAWSAGVDFALKKKNQIPTNKTTTIIIPVSNFFMV
jgi:hypothetical protein